MSQSMSFDLWGQSMGGREEYQTNDWYTTMRRWHCILRWLCRGNRTWQNGHLAKDSEMQKILRLERERNGCWWGQWTDKCKGSYSLWFFRSFCQFEVWEGGQNLEKTKENKKKNKTADPKKLSSALRAVHGVWHFVCFVFFWFSRVVFRFSQRDPPQRVLKLCFFCFLLCFSDLGDKGWGKMSRDSIFVWVVPKCFYGFAASLREGLIFYGV